MKSIRVRSFAGAVVIVISLLIPKIFGSTPKAGVATWMQLLPTSSPPARSYLAMMYDAASGKIVMFGGYDGTEDPFTPGCFEFELSRRPSVLIFSNQGNDEAQRDQYVGVFLAGLMQANSPARAGLRNTQSTGTSAQQLAVA